jgi:serine protease Do
MSTGTQRFGSLNRFGYAMSNASLMPSNRFFAVIGCLFLAGSAPVDAQEARSLLRQIDDGFVQVFEKVAPAVVVIDTERTSDEEGSQDPMSQFDFFFRNPDVDPTIPRRGPAPRTGQGSGFIIRKDGYIVTNNHVIDGSDKVEVKLRDGRKFPGKVIGTDSQTDIVVLKIEATDLPVAELGDSDKVRVGQLVAAIGVPYQLDWSFSAGWVSAKGRSGLTSTAYEDYIQTDAFINPGSSGGPLFDVEGRVIGMNTLIRGIGMGLAFAIPSNMIRDVSDQIIATGRVSRPWLGLKIETLGENPALSKVTEGVDHGVVVKSIVADTPAYKSDLRPADVITEIDSVPLRVAKDLQREVLKKKIGQSVTLTVWRKGQFLKIAVQTEQAPTDASRAGAAQAPAQPDASTPGSFYGIHVKPLTPEDAQRLGTDAKEGLLVEKVDPASPAAITDIKADDVITEVDQKPVKDRAAFEAAVKGSDPKKGVLLFIDRRGQKTYAVLKAE